MAPCPRVTSDVGSTLTLDLDPDQEGFFDGKHMSEVSAKDHSDIESGESLEPCSVEDTSCAEPRSTPGFTVTKRKRVVITDASGRLGRNLVQLCLQDERVVEVVAVTTKDIKEFRSPKLKVVRVDNLANWSQLKRRINGVDVCFMCLSLKPAKSIHVYDTLIPYKVAQELGKNNPQTKLSIVTSPTTASASQLTIEEQAERDSWEAKIRKAHARVNFTTATLPSLMNRRAKQDLTLASDLMSEAFDVEFNSFDNREVHTQAALFGKKLSSPLNSHIKRNQLSIHGTSVFGRRQSERPAERDFSSAEDKHFRAGRGGRTKSTGTGGPDQVKRLYREGSFTRPLTLDEEEAPLSRSRRELSPLRNIDSFRQLTRRRDAESRGKLGTKAIRNGRN